MSEGTLGKIVSKAGEAVAGFLERRCVSEEESNSSVQAYTEQTMTNAAGFQAFNDAFLKADIDGIMAAMTDDPIFDAPNPQPDGMCLKGSIPVRVAWETLFKAGVTFAVEEAFLTGDRAVTRWIAFRTVNGEKLSLRGSDIFYFKDGKVAAKLTYSKAESFLGIGIKIPT